MSIITAMKDVAIKSAFVLKKHAPQILIATGVISGVASSVMAARGTIVAMDAIRVSEDAKKRINETKNGTEMVLDGEHIVYDDDIRESDLKANRNETVLSVAKAYLPAVCLGVLSVTATLAGFRIMSTRFATAAAALNAVTKSFSDYRKRVAARYGEEVEYQFAHNLEPDGKPRTKEVVKEDGSVETVEEKPEYSIYMKVFDKGNKNWNESPELNAYFLRQVENYLNDTLIRRGHVYLNEAYDALGFNRTRLGSIAGWTYDKENPKGDNCIDIGIGFDRSEFRDIINGYNDAIILDFNCQGSIINDVETHQF